MSTPDIRLLGIVGPPVVPLNRIVEAACDAERGGVTAIQLRAKSTPAGELLRLAEVLVGTLAVPVYVNDRADVAWLGSACGVHVGADDLPPRHIRAFAPRPFQIGVSVGTPDEAERAQRDAVDYWSVGPVYATHTKPDAGQPIGIGGFRALAARAPMGMPVIAIGGIDATNAAEVLRAGAAGIAVSSAIFGAGDVEKAVRVLRQVVDSEQKQVSG